MPIESTLLIHLMQWKASQDTYVLDDWVTLHRTAGSAVEKEYHMLCETRNIDDGDPFEFTTHVHISENIDLGEHLDLRGPHSIIARLCNVLTISTARPLGMCRIIAKNNDPEYIWTHTEILFDYNPSFELLISYPDGINFGGDGSVSTHGGPPAVVDDITLKRMKHCWNTLRKLRDSTRVDNHRLQNSLTYYFYSWNSYDLEQTCLNLAIVLESLFAPYSRDEIAHQVAFNVSRFVGDSPDVREQVYRTVKKFYNLRSEVVHGGKPKVKDLYLQTPEMFYLCTRILARLLIEEDLALTFSTEESRQNLLRSWLFGRET